MASNFSAGKKTNGLRVMMVRVPEITVRQLTLMAKTIGRSEEDLLTHMIGSEYDQFTRAIQARLLQEGSMVLPLAPAEIAAVLPLAIEEDAPVTVSEGKEGV